MHAFEYASPTTKEEALRLLAGRAGEAEIMAGGTDLISLMKDAVQTPMRVVSLKHIKELHGIEFKPGEGLHLGAMATFQELLDHEVVRKNYPALVEAAEGVSSPQIRSTGTVGGDLCQRPRCWYYRAGFGLLARAGDHALVPDGDNRYHAILGNSGPAYFVNPSSLAPILIALGAKVRIAGPKGSRELALEKFFLTPASATERENALEPNEIVTDVLVPHHAGVKTAVYEVRQKEALDWPLAAAAVALHIDGNSVRGSAVVLGHVAPVPWPSRDAEEALAGKTISEETAESAGKAAVRKATPLSGNGYKVQLARVAVKRALLRAAEREA